MFSSGKDDFSNRFWSKVDKTSTCWNWQGALNEKGYGLFKVGGKYGVAAKTHRVVWKMLVGSIPINMCVLHKCDNRRCVNPDHLYLGTHQDNMNDMKNKDRQYKKRI